MAAQSGTTSMVQFVHPEATSLMSPLAASSEVYELILNLPRRDQAQALPELSEQKILRIISDLGNQLGNIIIKHSNRYDLLSMNLFSAGNDAINFVAMHLNSHAGAPIQDHINEFVRNGIEKVKIIEKILTNPHGNRMLRQPILAHDAITWEASDVERYVNYVSTTFRAEIAENPDQYTIPTEPHVFAQEMIVWVDQFQQEITAWENQLPADDEKEDRDDLAMSLPVAPSSSQILKLKRPPKPRSQEEIEDEFFEKCQSQIAVAIAMQNELYQTLIACAQSDAELAAYRAENDRYAAMIDETSRERREELARYEEASQQQVAELQEHLDGINRLCEQRVDDLKAINAATNEILTQTRIEVKEAKEESARNAADLQSARAAIWNLQGQLSDLANSRRPKRRCEIM